MVPCVWYGCLSALRGMCTLRPHPTPRTSFPQSEVDALAGRLAAGGAAFHQAAAELCAVAGAPAPAFDRGPPDVGAALLPWPSLPAHRDAPSASPAPPPLRGTVLSAARAAEVCARGDVPAEVCVVVVSFSFWFAYSRPFGPVR